MSTTCLILSCQSDGGLCLRIVNISGLTRGFMAGGLSRDEVSKIVEATYRGSLEEPELSKKIAGIPKLLDKYEGKWDRMVESMYGKYGKPGPDAADESKAEKSAKKSDEAAKAKADRDRVAREKKEAAAKEKAEAAAR